MSQELGLGLLRGAPRGSESQTGRSVGKEGQSRNSEQGCGVGPGEVGRGTYHNLVAFDQRDSEVEDLYVDGFHIGDLQVPTSELIGGAHDKVVLEGSQPAKLGEGVAAGAHEVVQGSIKCQVVGIPRDSAGGRPWEGGNGVQRGALTLRFHPGESILGQSP